MVAQLRELVEAAQRAVRAAWKASLPLQAKVWPLLAQTQWSTVATALAVVVAAATLTYGGYYLKTGRPLVFAPGVPAVPVVGQAVVALPPRYVFSFSGMINPLSVAVSPDGGRVYVAEGAGERLVRVFDSEGKTLNPLPAPPGAEKILRLPAGLAVAKDGKVYVSDRIMGAVHQYSPDGKYLGPFIPAGSANLLPSPLGIALSGKDELYVTEVSPGNHRLMAFDAGRRLRMAFGREGHGDGEFNFPNGIAVDGKGRVFVADANNARVGAYDKDGNYLGRLPGDASLPRGLALDSVGRLYVVDGINDEVAVIDVTQDPPKALFSFGGPGTREGQFLSPNGIAVDSATGRIYVADRANNRVSVWAY